MLYFFAEIPFTMTPEPPSGTVSTLLCYLLMFSTLLKRYQNYAGFQRFLALVELGSKWQAAGVWGLGASLSQRSCGNQALVPQPKSIVQSQSEPSHKSFWPCFINRFQGYTRCIAVTSRATNQSYRACGWRGFPDSADPRHLSWQRPSTNKYRTDCTDCGGCVAGASCCTPSGSESRYQPCTSSLRPAFLLSVLLQFLLRHRAPVHLW